MLAHIRAHDARVGVMGLGYVGLPLVRGFCEAGFRVVGFDIDPTKVKRLVSGESYIEHIPEHTIRQLLAAGFEPTTDFSRLAECDAVIICVPTPLTRQREPDVSFIEQTSRDIAATLRPGQLVVLESSTYPGTMDDIVKPILEATGLRAGADFFLAYSPEREDPANPKFTMTAIPKLVGGHDPASLEVAAALYGEVVETVVPVSSMRVAEATKITENIYRAVNIALVNELKVLFDAMDIDVWEVVDAASTKPFGFQPFYPGPGWGGHCIPCDPFYLTWKAREFDRPTRFVELAGEINAVMPSYVIDRVALALNDRGKPVKGSKVLVLGIAYKADIGDDRESPSYRLMEILQERGAIVSYNDPYVTRLHPTRRYDFDLESTSLEPDVVTAADCVLISTAHSDYDWDAIVGHAQLVVDTRNATRHVTTGRDKIVKA